MAYIAAIAVATISNSRIGRRSGALSVTSCKGAAVSGPATQSAAFSFGEEIDPGAGGSVVVIAGFSGPAPLIR